MREPATTLTDFALAALSAVFAVWLPVGASALTPLCLYFTGVFAALGVAAGAGGLVHGFFPDGSGMANRWLWRATLLSIGAAAFCVWGLSAELIVPTPYRVWLIGIAGLVFLLYATVVLWVRQDFLVAILHYLPAVLFALVSFAILMVEPDDRGALYCFIGVAGTVLAAAVQALRLGLHPRYFDHNAAYHGIQALAIAFIFAGARDLVV